MQSESYPSWPEHPARQRKIRYCCSRWQHDDRGSERTAIRSGPNNNGEFLFHTGFKLAENVETFTVKWVVANPGAIAGGSDITNNFQQIGGYIGDGTQSNFLKIVAIATNDDATTANIQIVLENGDPFCKPSTCRPTTSSTTPILVQDSAITFELEIDPTAATATPKATFVTTSGDVEITGTTVHRPDRFRSAGRRSWARTPFRVRKSVSLPVCFVQRSGRGRHVPGRVRQHHRDRNRGAGCARCGGRQRDHGRRYGADHPGRPASRQRHRCQCRRYADRHRCLEPTERDRFTRCRHRDLYAEQRL